MAYSVLCLFLAVLWVGLFSMILAFPGHIHMLFDEKRKTRKLHFKRKWLPIYRQKQITMECLKSEYVIIAADFQFVTYNASDVFPCWIVGQTKSRVTSTTYSILVNRG